MKLYHGTSCRTIEKFVLNKCRSKLDFGTGVYFTSNFKQAKKWSCDKDANGAVYEVDVNLDDFKIFTCDNHKEDFMYILYLSRIGLEEIVPECIDNFEKIDIVSGMMLKNPRHFKKKAEKFNSGDISFEKLCAHTRLWKKPYDQICVKNDLTLEIFNRSIKKIYYTKMENGKVKIVKTKVIERS